MHPQNKMLGSDPFYFHFIFLFFILKGAPAPSFYLGTPDGGHGLIRMIFRLEPQFCSGYSHGLSLNYSHMFKWFSQHVPNVFPTFSWCFPNIFHCFPNIFLNVFLTFSLWDFLLARGQDCGFQLFRVFFVFFSCFFLCSVFVIFSCFFRVFFLLFFLFFFTICGCCFFFRLLFSSGCHALSDVLPHFSNPGFSLLRLNMSAKYSCKNTEYDTFDFGSSGPNRTPTQKGKNDHEKNTKK